jgi:hypothetical protein
VFELKGSLPQGTMPFPVAHLSLHAVHERFFALKLEGENLGSDGEAWRSRKAEELSPHFPGEWSDLSPFKMFSL